VFLETQEPQPWQLDCIRVDVDGAGETCAADGFFLALELGIATLALPFALLLQFDFAKEVLESAVEVSKCLLWSALLTSYIQGISVFFKALISRCKSSAYGVGKPAL